MKVRYIIGIGLYTKGQIDHIQEWGRMFEIGAIDYNGIKYYTPRFTFTV